jgi:acetoin utilization deacetylase AcuC-like enzyme
MVSMIKEYSMKNIAFFYPEGHAQHHFPGHPERPERVEIIRQALEDAGCWKQYPLLQPVEPPGSILKSIHDPAYLEYLKASCRRGERLNPDTYVTPASWELALNAAGGAISVASAVWDRQVKRGFALTRPPGHHATTEMGMGFCLINNVAAAAEYLLKEAGAQRLAILDLDLHHGNGTQDIFWKREDVFFLSTHQSPLYPGTGRIQERGKGAGFGTNVNIPLPPGSGDEAFEAVLEQVVLPLLMRYNPEMLLISFGFDTHWMDPLGSLLLSADRYAWMIAQLAAYADQHCQGRIALFLEGGYDLNAASVCSKAVVKALLGQEWNDPLGPSPHLEGQSWQGVVAQIIQVWELDGN